MKTLTILLLAGLFGLCLFMAGCSIVPQKQAAYPDGSPAFLDENGKATREPKAADGTEHKPLMLHDIDAMQRQIKSLEDATKDVPVVGPWVALGIGLLGGGIGVPVAQQLNAARKKKAGLPEAEPAKATA